MRELLDQISTEFAVPFVLVGSVVVFGTAAVLALAWSTRSGQFENFGRSARSIFDADEPEGMPTDRLFAVRTSNRTSSAAPIDHPAAARSISE